MPVEASIPSPLNAATVSAELGIRGLRFISSLQFRLASSSRPTEGSSDVKNDPDYRYPPDPPSETFCVSDQLLCGSTR
jgi:hypothetical protein